jgi:hypothetical protein
MAFPLVFAIACALERACEANDSEIELSECNVRQHGRRRNFKNQGVESSIRCPAAGRNLAVRWQRLCA